MPEKVSEKILAIETSGKSLGVALLASAPGGGITVPGEVFLEAGTRHSEALSSACRFLTFSCGWEKVDLTLLAVCTGPGSFTGLRVGVAYARTLAQFLKIPLLGISAFEVLARSAAKVWSSQADLFCVLVESIGNDVFAGFYRPRSRKFQGAFQAVAVPDLMKQLEKLSAKKILFVGRAGFKLEAALRRSLKGKTVLLPRDPLLHAPQARVLAEIAWERARSARPSAQAWRKVVPAYLRKPIAVERREYRNQRI